ncbi:hypothetical protein [Hymenobacter sp. BRD67]|uniref:hypothetical protein n=1 Tax=Hymenobacter sp. BRD67 TaxID=2675877 RepID=UPI001566FFFF|nr:hypothetical protein [Hymenobacter sp. BRD67]QKG53087.1 hypothetical protein GKZ67_11365 [Hymenobacter sp. BRD67]
MAPTSPTTSQLVTAVLILLPIFGAAIIAGQRYRQLPGNLRCLAWLAWFELPLDLGGEIMGLLQRNNLFIMPLYTVGEFWLLALMYRRTLQSAAFNKVVPWLVGGFAAYALLDSLLAADLTRFRPGQQVIQGLLILAMVGLYFRKLLHELQTRSLTREPMFWVSIGLFLYFVGYLQIALFSNYMMQHYSMAFNRNIWTIHTGLIILLHCCYCRALVIRPRPAQA